MSPAATQLLGSLVLPAATLVLWLVRAVGSVVRRDGTYRLVPVLGMPFVALALLAVPSLLPADRDPLAASEPGWPLGWRSVVWADGLLTLVLVAGLGLLELPLWAARGLARRRVAHA